MQRRNHRLDRSQYKGTVLAYLTICCNKMEPLLNQSDSIKMVIRILKKCSIRFDIDILAYVIMTNHLHLLARGTTPDSDLIAFVKLFKQQTGYTWKQSHKHQLWQKSYYDHLLRNDKNVEGIMWYIFQNPVRAGLVRNYKTYPYAASWVWSGQELDHMFSNSNMET